MPRFKVTVSREVTDTVSTDLDIEATDQAEAMRIADEWFQSGQLSLDKVHEGESGPVRYEVKDA